MNKNLSKGYSTIQLISIFFMLSILISCTAKPEISEKTEIKDQEIQKKATSYLDQISRFISGMHQVDTGSISRYEKSVSWQKYATLSDSSWAKLNREKMNSMSEWAQHEIIQKEEARETVFYPFSGPDILHAITLFPNAKNYILVGLEPIGSLPSENELKKDSLRGYFQGIERSQRDVLNFSFFKTNNMAVDLKQRDLNGSLPILLIFLRRTGHEIIKLDSITNFQSKGKRAIQGIQIVFQKDGKEKFLYYFSADLTDFAIREQTGFLSFLESYKRVSTFLKSASYLMHRPNFSFIKNLILNKSDYILEDDSGISYSDFKENEWTLQVYGNYMVPIYLFTQFYNLPLHEKFKKEARPLPFGIGYHWREKESNLIFAIKKQP